MRFPGASVLAATFSVIIALFAGPALAEKRVALVVGINNYPNLKNGQLTRAVADAETMADLLKNRLGFDVELARNVDQSAFLTAIDRVKRKIGSGDTVFVFFAGHGVGLRGTNLLLPSDIPAVGPESEQLLRGRSVAETDLIEAVREKKAKLLILTLDACRDNPIEEFAKEQARIQGRAFRSTGTMRQIGLEVRPTSGVFSIYSAGIGQRALDRLETDAATERNSVFTRVFARNLRNADGRHLSDIMEEVKEEVAQLAAKQIDPDTRLPHTQSPAYYNETLGGRIFLSGLPAGDAEQRAAEERRRRAAEERRRQAEEDERIAEERRRRADEDRRRRIEEEDRIRREAEVRRQQEEEARRRREAALTPTQTLWDHNNSIMLVKLSSTGIEIYYQNPRQGMIDEGVRSGTLLFSGQRNGDRVSGTAYVFDRRCGKLPYPDEGEIIGDRRIILNGRRVPTQLTSDCRVTGFRTDASVFSKRD
ncbi:MAG: caspase family protein [Pseudomonadota bacterium]